MYYRIFSKIYERAAEKMCQECASFVKKSSKILDLGCGSAIVGKVFQDFFQAEVIGIDIKDKRTSSLPFQVYDGKNLPFPERSFDIVLINYVLHHCQDALAVLKEAKRVVRDKIIIYEDLPENFLSKIICKFHSITFSNFFQKNREVGNFQTEKDWEKIFMELGLNVIFKRRINNFPLKKELFILEI